jgi:endonuclease YncB( thermonuclease family)
MNTAPVRITHAFLILLFLPALAASETITGRVVRVVDGDTAYVLDAARTQHKVRLQGIDAPERGQPFGKRSKEHLSDLIAGQDVVVDWDKRDRYGRIVGKILDEERDVNLAMVRAGYAWWYRKYADEQSAADRVLYEDAEESAKAEGVGLWRDPAPIPPWEWRRR